MASHTIEDTQAKTLVKGPYKPLQTVVGRCKLGPSAWDIQKSRWSSLDYCTETELAKTRSRMQWGVGLASRMSEKQDWDIPENRESFVD